MNSIHQSVTILHEAYCAAMGIDLALAFSTERMWLEAHNQGMTPDDVRLCLEYRLKSNLENTFKFGVTIRQIAGDDDAVANTMCEAALVRSKKRIKVIDPARASVLRATGREDQPPQEQARAVSALPLIQALRRAAE